MRREEALAVVVGVVVGLFFAVALLVVLGIL
jgi:hypothetical protein